MKMISRGWGKAMYGLEHDSRYALGRCVLTFPKNPKAGLNMRARNGTTCPSLKVYAGETRN